LVQCWPGHRTLIDGRGVVVSNDVMRHVIVSLKPSAANQSKAYVVAQLLAA